MSLGFIPLVALAAALPPGPARYDLRPGDHLVFEETVKRSVEGRDARYETQMRFRNHVLVTGEGRGSLRVGIQRGRVAAELVKYDGPGGIAKERAEYDARVAKLPVAFAEANWLTPAGIALLPASVLRETRSELLPHILELPPLPPLLPGARDRWRSPGALGLSFEAAGAEAIGDESCRRFDGADDAKTVRVGLWFCEASGSLGRLVYEGTYTTPPSSVVRETVRLERRERRRGEALQSWIGEAETREGVLASLLVSDVAADPAALAPLLDSGVPNLQEKALAVLYRHRLPAPALSPLGLLLQAKDPRLRALAVRNLERVPDAEARPWLERARADPDSFVAGAGLAGLQRFAPPPSPELAALARAAPDWASLPGWSCGMGSDWPEKALAAQRRAGQSPGATLRTMASPSHAGWPYVLYVPDDYRGDEPFPLLIVLGGGPGKAIPTAQGMRESLDARGFLAVFPHAGGPWWEKTSTSAVPVLLEEVLHDLNVDTNRVYLTGFSNGGTGTFLYSTLWPHRLAAAASLMGGGLPFFGAEPPSLDNLRVLPLLFIHGDKDEVIPVRATLLTVKALERLGQSPPVESHILPGRGHDIVVGGDDGLTLPFFEARKRDPFPRRLHFATRSLEFARDFWIAIVGKDGGEAEVSAEIASDNTITVTSRRVRHLRLLLRRELLAADAPVVVRWNGREVFRGPFREDCALLARSWRETRDPFLAHSFAVDLDAAPADRASVPVQR